jgi:hypothetical protein
MIVRKKLIFDDNYNRKMNVNQFIVSCLLTEIKKVVTKHIFITNINEVTHK